MPLDRSLAAPGPGEDPRAYGRQLALDGLLESVFSAERSAATRRNKRRRYRAWSAAAALLAGLVFYFFPTSPAASAIARVERVRGTVRVLTDGKKVEAVIGQNLFPGQGLEVAGRESGADVTYPDGTRLRVGPDTSVRELGEKEGKSVALSGGVLDAVVTPQPAGRPMVFRFPQGEAAVLGTTLKLVVEPDPARGSTRLEVAEGKVRLTRRGDGKAVDVLSGHFAVAAVGVELAAKTLSGDLPFGGASGTAEDTLLYGFQGFENENYGARPRLRISYGNPGYTALLRFPGLVGTGPGRVPPGSAVASATLRLRTFRSPGDLLRFRFSRCLKPWNVGRGTPGPALPGEVTWASAQHGALKWEVAGAKGPTDRAPEWTTPAVRVEPGGFATFDLTPIVRAWAAGEENLGLFIDAVGEAGDDVSASEDPLPDHRPRLTVTLKR